MIWVIVILIIIAIGSWASTQFNIISDQVFENIFTILAILSAICGAIYYWASKKTYEDHKMKDDLIKKYNDNEIDITSMSMEVLKRELEGVLNTPKPVFFKTFGNNRLQLDSERIGILNDAIQNTIRANSSLAQMEVEKAFNHEFFTELSKKNIAELKSQISHMEYDLKDREMSLKEREAQLEIKNLESINFRNKIEAETYAMKLKSTDESKLSELTAKLYDKIISEMNIENITPSQTLILLSLFGRGKVDNIEDYEMKRKMMEQEIMKMSQEVEGKKEQNKSAFLDNENKKFNFERNKNKNI